MSYIGIAPLKDVVLAIVKPLVIRTKILLMILVCILLKPRLLVPVFTQKTKLLNVKFRP